MALIFPRLKYNPDFNIIHISYQSECLPARTDKCGLASHITYRKDRR